VILSGIDAPSSWSSRRRSYPLVLLDSKEGGSTWSKADQSRGYSLRETGEIYPNPH
jgi:hypothetical protein